MARKKSMVPAIILTFAVCAVAVAGAWAFNRYANPTVDMSSIDALDDSISRIKATLAPDDQKRLEQHYKRNRAGFLSSIIRLRMAGGTGEFHGMSGVEFLAVMDRDWASKEEERRQELEQVIQQISEEAARAIASIEGEFDSLSRDVAPEEVERAREDIKRRVATVKTEEKKAIQKAKSIAIQP